MLAFRRLAPSSVGRLSVFPKSFSSIVPQALGTTSEIVSIPDVIKVNDVCHKFHLMPLVYCSEISLRMKTARLDRRLYSLVASIDRQTRSSNYLQWRVCWLRVARLPSSYLICDLQQPFFEHLLRSILNITWCHQQHCDYNYSISTTLIFKALCRIMINIDCLVVKEMHIRTTERINVNSFRELEYLHQFSPHSYVQLKHLHGHILGISLPIQSNQIK